MIKRTSCGSATVKLLDSKDAKRIEIVGTKCKVWLYELDTKEDANTVFALADMVSLYSLLHVLSDCAEDVMEAE